MDILSKIIISARERVEREKAAVPLADMKRLAEAVKSPDFAFEKALQGRGLSFICEIKRASPSKGLIAQDFPYAEIARDYAEGGTAAISVLTEPQYFQGSDEYLREIAAIVPVPLLRKDFTVDPYQIYQARALGASAILLICAALDEKSLADYVALADSLGLSALAETRDEREVRMALNAGARIVGVNNRDLKTFAVDANTCLRLRGAVPPGVLFVAESGVQTRADTLALENGGVDAALIGEALMRAADRRGKLRELMGTSEVTARE